MASLAQFIASPVVADVPGAIQQNRATRSKLANLSANTEAQRLENERAPEQFAQEDALFNSKIQTAIIDRMTKLDDRTRERELEQARVVSELGVDGALQLAGQRPDFFDQDDIEVLRSSPEQANMIARATLAAQDALPKPDNQLVEVYDPNSPTGTRMVPRAQAAGMPGKPGSGTSVSVTPDGTVQFTQGRGAAGKAPSGYRWKEDGRLEPIPGGPADKVSGEMAGKLAGIQQAFEQDIPLVKTKLFDDGGSLNRDLLIRPPGTEGFGETRNIRQAIQRALTAVLRMESGAAVPDSEVARYTDQYMPSFLDTDEGAARKIEALETRMTNAMENAGRAEAGEKEDPLGIR